MAGKESEDHRDLSASASTIWEQILHAASTADLSFAQRDGHSIKQVETFYAAIAE